MALTVPPPFALSSLNSTSVLAYSSAEQPYCPVKSHDAPWEFHPVTEPPIVVVARQIGRLAVVQFGWRILTSVYSRLPTFTFPTARAEATGACATTPAAAAYATAVCTAPPGSYEDSCQKAVVTYSPYTGLCTASTRCATMYEGLPHKPTSIHFAPGDKLLFVENRNGTLVVVRQSQADAFNARLDALPKTTLTPDALIKAQKAIIAELPPGAVLTLDSDRQPKILSSAAIKASPKASAFHRFAEDTGGIMGLSSSPENLHPLIDTMVAHVLKTGGPDGAIDIAFVIDTTQSMEPNIAQVKSKLVALLQQLPKHCRVALLQYRDQREAFLTKIDTDFTSDFAYVQEVVSRMDTDGGGDSPEAVLDALNEARKSFSWNPAATRVVFLIGDAPPHPRAANGADATVVIEAYRAADTHIAVYPIFS